MNHLRKMDWSNLTHEYRVDAKRLLPWEGLNSPFGGAWAVVRAGTTSLDHVNEPYGEEELFICMSGKVQAILNGELIEMTPGDVLHIPSGVSHYLHNPYPEDCHIYSIWWDPSSARRYLQICGGVA